jgi:hypothetical protein
VKKYKTDFMVVRIRFGRGPVVTRRRGKNSRIAQLASSMLTLVSIGCAAMGMWRVGTDLDWAGEFAFSTGFFSHWQVWIGAAGLIQYTSLRLLNYARAARETEAEIIEQSEQTQVKAAASV